MIIFISRKVFTESLSLIMILNVQFPEETSFPVSGWRPQQCCVVLWYRFIAVPFGYIFRNVNISYPNFIFQLRVYLISPTKQKYIRTCAF